MKFTENDTDVDTSNAVKRPAPEGTPDKEAHARSKAQASELAPRVLATEVQDPVSKVEMSTATIAAMRVVMREEISHGMQELEHGLTQKVDEKLIHLQHDLERKKNDNNWKNALPNWNKDTSRHGTGRRAPTSKTLTSPWS